MSVHWLPCLCTIHFCIVSERIFIRLTSSALWGKAGADFITKAGKRAMSVEITPLAILVMDRVGEGKLGMITAFCRTDQVKVEPLDALLTLVHPIFHGCPLDPLPGHNHPFSGHFDHPIPTCPTAFAQVAPLFSHSDHPSTRERGGWTKYLPSPHGDTVGELKSRALFVPPLPLSVPIVSSHSNRDMSMQTKEVLGFILTLRQLQEVIKAKAQLE